MRKKITKFTANAALRKKTESISQFVGNHQDAIKVNTGHNVLLKCWCPLHKIRQQDLFLQKLIV